MKKIITFFMSIVLSFSFCFSASAVNLNKSPSINLSPVADNIIDLLIDICDDYNSSIENRTIASRWFFFYYMINNKMRCSSQMFDDDNTTFSVEFLQYYFDYYMTSVGRLHGSHFYTEPYYLSDGDVFIRAVGYDCPFDLNFLSYIEPSYTDVLRDSMKESDSLLYMMFYNRGVANRFELRIFKDFCSSINQMLAQYLISQNVSDIIDPNPGKSGLEIAPAYVSSDEFAESLEKDNDYYFPRKDYRKVSYRNDPTFQRFVKFKATNNNRQYYPTIKYEDKFLYGSGNDLYFVLYANVDDDKRGYGVYQYHLTFEDVKNEEGTVVKRVPHLFRWNVVTQTEADAVDVSSSVTNGFPNFSDTANCEYVRSSFENKIMKLYCFNTFDDFMNGNSSYCYYKFNLDSDNLDCISRDMSTRFSYLTCTSSQHNFVGSYEKHAETCSSTTDDLGYICDGEPLSLTSYLFDISRIPKGQIVTINGDTIYNYTITNPETGDSSKFGDYIENNYTYITNNNGGSVGGDVTVGGKIDVGGSVAVDVNVNVNGAGGSGSVNPSDFTSAENVDLTKYYDNAVEQSTGFQKFLKDFFGFLPAEVLGLILFAVSMAIICRVFGR